MMTMNGITQYPELEVVLNDHAKRLQGTRGDFLIGVYLVGSPAIGDFDPTSDVPQGLSSVLRHQQSPIPSGPPLR